MTLHIITDEISIHHGAHGRDTVDFGRGGRRCLTSGDAAFIITRFMR